MADTLVTILGFIVAGIFTGFGNAIGNYLGHKHGVNKIDKAEETIRKVGNKIEQASKQLENIEKK